MNKEGLIVLSQNAERKLPNKVKIGYGFPGASYFLAFNILALWLIFYFTDVVGISAAFAGTIASVGILWDAISDPLVGLWSDNLKPKSGEGRRRPFLKWVAVPFGLCIWLMFTNWGLSEFATKIYYVVVAVGLYTCMTVLDIPYTALGAEMTTNYDDRSSLANFRNIFSQIANVGTTFVIMLAGIFGASAVDPAGWSKAAALVGAIATIFILIGWKATKGCEITELASKEKVTFKDYGAVLKNKPFRNVIYMYSLSILAMGFVNTLLVFFLFIVGGLSDEQLVPALLTVYGVSIVFAPVINWVSHKFSKKIAWVFSMGSWAIVLILFPMVIIPSMANPVAGAFAMLFFSAIGASGQYQVAWSMIPDCVELDEFQTGQRREGVFYACATLIQKVFTALAMLVAGIMLEKIGYTGLESVTEQTGVGIRYLFAFGSGIPLALSAIVVLWTPMTRARHAALTEAIQLKKAGKPFSINGFKELFNNDEEIVKYKHSA